MCYGSLTFTQEADEAPHEVTAAVAEGGFGQGDSLEAVARRRALVLGPEPGRLLRPLLHRQRARSPAAVGHVHTQSLRQAGETQREGLRHGKARISRKYSTPSGEHPTGPDTAAQPGERALRSVGVFPLLPKLII